MVTEIDPKTLQASIEANQPPLVIDVREGWELEIARLPFAMHLPMHEIPDRLDELPRDRAIVVMCRSGARSLQVGEYLEQRGFDHVANLAGVNRSTRQ